MRKLLLLQLICLLFSLGLLGQKQKTILFIFAHPDDETTVSEVMIKYTKLGYKVQLLITADGKYGTRVTNISEGDSLGNIRKEETRCACKIMGIAEPVFLGIERLDTKIGVRNYFNEHKKLLDTLKVLIPTIKPDIIITFGPDGDTHHSEHIVTGAAVTELLLQQGWVEKYPLYYLAWTKELGESAELGYVHDKYFNIKIEYSDEDELKGLEAMKCYISQFTPEEMREDYDKKIKDTKNFIHFRKFVVQKGLKNDFFK